MSFFTVIGHFFEKIGKYLGSALHFAVDQGLTDALVQDALTYVRVAALKFADNTEKREYVVAVLVSRGVPETIARLAVQFAYVLFQREVGKLGSLGTQPSDG